VAWRTAPLVCSTASRAIGLCSWGWAEYAQDGNRVTDPAQWGTANSGRKTKSASAVSSCSCFIISVCTYGHKASEDKAIAAGWGTSTVSGNSLMRLTTCVHRQRVRVRACRLSYQGLLHRELSLSVDRRFFTLLVRSSRLCGRDGLLALRLLSSNNEVSRGMQAYALMFGASFFL
jgi:hypothetical protein